MKYRALESFRRYLARLPPQHQKMFKQALREHSLPAIEAGSFAGTPPRPRRLRIHRLSNSEIYSLTWNFASPDGRATFHLDKSDIGDHGIYREP